MRSAIVAQLGALLLYATTQANAQISEVGLSFNGTSGSINCGTASALGFGGAQAFTLEAWVRTETWLGGDPHRMVISKYNGGVAGAWQFAVRNNDTLGFSREVSPNFMNGTTSVPLSTWTHVAATYDGTTMRTYVNGTLDVSETRGSSSTTTQPVLIGAQQTSSSPSNFFRGVMHEVRVWNVARSSTELMDNKDAQLTGSESNLVGYWRMDSLSNLGAGSDSQIDDIEDLSSNNNHGDLSASGVTIVTSDLITGVTASAADIDLNSNVTYSVSVENDGPMLAGDTVVVVTFPANMTFVSTTLDSMDYTLTATDMTLDPMTLKDQETINFDVVMQGTSLGSGTITVNATQNEADMSSADNEDTASTNVNLSSGVDDWRILGSAQ